MVDLTFICTPTQKWPTEIFNNIMFIWYSLHRQIVATDESPISVLVVGCCKI